MNEKAAVGEAEVAIRYGNREGRYFTQWRFDDLKMMADSIQERRPRITEFEIWYDEPRDYHCLGFLIGGKSIVVRYYKVFAAMIAGVEGWTGCPRSSQFEFIAYLCKNADGLEDAAAIK